MNLLGTSQADILDNRVGIQIFTAFCLFFSLLTVSCFPALSAENLFYGDFTLGLGGVSALSGNVKMVEYSAGFTYGYIWRRHFIIGGTTDYQLYGQLSNYNPNYGNQRGVRFQYFAPSLGYLSRRFTLKADVQFLGDYELSIQTTNGDKIKYQRPLGYRVSALFMVQPAAFAGVSYQSIDYRRSKEGSDSAVDQSPALDFTSLQIIWSFLF